MKTTLDKINTHYGYVFENELIEEINYVANLRKLNEGDTIISYGDTFKYMPLLIKGANKVFREDEKAMKFHSITSRKEIHVLCRCLAVWEIKKVRFKQL